MNYLIVILNTAVLFLAIILALAVKTSISAKITQTFVAAAVVGGLLFYGYGFAEIMQDTSMAIVRATLAVCGMFVGKNDWSAINGASLLQNMHSQVIFWILHLMALYATASAAIATIGASALRELRLFMIRKGHLVLIYGVNSDSLTLGRELNMQKGVSVLYVADHPDGSMVSAIEGMGCIVRSDSNALHVTRSFLRGIGMLGLGSGKRKVSVYALDKDEQKNISFSGKCVRSFQENGISPKQTHLIFLTSDENAAEQLIAVTKEGSGEYVQYGFGTVYGFSEEDLAARSLIHNYPPCNYVSFDEDARGTSDFDAVIVGFGMIGQAVLKQLVMNSQFAGSRLHIAVAAKDLDQVSGYIRYTSPELFRQFDIELLQIDAGSPEFYEYLTNHKDTLNYMVLCTGSEKDNNELAYLYLKFADHLGCRLNIFQCHYNGIRNMSSGSTEYSTYNIYSKALLDPEKRDRLAMLLNDYYEGNPLTAPEVSWSRCNYFNKLSSCAAADAIPTYLHMLHQTKEDVLKNGFPVSEKQLENLGESEHLRWCAFHQVMGYQKMTDAVFEERKAHFEEIARREGMEKAGKYKISKDPDRKMHACLISWDELDRLSEKEKKITGKKNLDYKQLDKNNVLLIEQLLKAESQL